MDKMRDDLESTKQLLELEVRSKSLLEKDNKRLQNEIEKLKNEFNTLKQTGQSDQTPDILENILAKERKDSLSKERRESIKEKRKSVTDNVMEDAAAVVTNQTISEDVPEEVKIFMALKIKNYL